MRLFNNKLQMASKCGKNRNVAHEAIAECLPHFDVVCDLLLNRRTQLLDEVFVIRSR